SGSLFRHRPVPLPIAAMAQLAGRCYDDRGYLLATWIYRKTSAATCQEIPEPSWTVPLHVKGMEAFLARSLMLWQQAHRVSCSTDQEVISDGTHRRYGVTQTG